MISSVHGSSLFLGKVSDDDLSIMQRAVNENSSYPEIHTLACLYAEIGNTKEARELLLRALHSVGMDEPNEPIWYGFGRIAEDYGLQSVAHSLSQPSVGLRMQMFPRRRATWPAYEKGCFNQQFPGRQRGSNRSLGFDTKGSTASDDPTIVVLSF
jgi:hypothetical protein